MLINLFEGDQRAQTLLDKLDEAAFEYGENMPLPTVLGVIRLLEHAIIERHK